MQRPQTYLKIYGVGRTEDQLVKIAHEFRQTHPGVSYFGVQLYTKRLNQMSRQEGLTKMSSQKICELLLGLAEQKKLGHKKFRLGDTIGSRDYDAFGLYDPLDFLRDR